MDVERTARFTAVAAEQHGAISGRQLAELGYSRGQVRALTARGVLRWVRTGVYVVAGSPETWRRRLQIGLLALGPSAVVSHEAAAALHRFDRCLFEPVEFTVPRELRRRGAGLTLHTATGMIAGDRVRVAGFACTSVTRTLVDLAVSGVPRVRLEAAMDSAVRAGSTTVAVIERRLAAIGDPRAVALARLLPDGGGHSPLERRFLALVRRAGLPRPQTQVVHRIGARTLARVDFLWPDVDLVVEVSGRLGHRSDAEASANAARRNELEERGRRVRELTHEQVVTDEAAVVALLRRWLSPNRSPEQPPR